MSGLADTRGGRSGPGNKRNQNGGGSDSMMGEPTVYPMPTPTEMPKQDQLSGPRMAKTDHTNLPPYDGVKNYEDRMGITAEKERLAKEAAANAAKERNYFAGAVLWGIILLSFLLNKH